MAGNVQEIADYLRGIKFRKKLIGGVDEEDVWAVMDRLQREYQEVLDIQKSYYEGSIAEKDKELKQLAATGVNG